MITFADSSAIERLTKMMNDTFDVLNGRHDKEGITVENWATKKKVLDVMLEVLSHTERIYLKDKSRKMFCSTTTLRGWRITIKSVIVLTEKLFNTDYDIVLTGKLNQDPVEVKIFSICIF